MVVIQYLTDICVRCFIQARREEEYEKLDRICTAISAKASMNSKVTISPYVIEDNAKDLLLDHVSEVVSAVIEGAKTLSAHKGSDVISVSDVQLILGNII